MSVPAPCCLWQARTLRCSFLTNELDHPLDMLRQHARASVLKSAEYSIREPSSIDRSLDDIMAKQIHGASKAKRRIPLLAYPISFSFVDQCDRTRFDGVCNGRSFA